MPQRILTEDEFNTLKQSLLRQAPDGLDEEQFNRWFTPRMEGAIAEAENSNAPVSGRGIGRFLAGAGEMLNPITAVKGLAHAVAHPLDTVDSMIDASAEQYGKAREAFGQGRLTEAVGHGLAGTLPVIGPAAAGIGEQIGAGDVAGGLGAATGMVAGPAAVRGVTRGVGKVAQPVAQRAAETLYQSALKPTKSVLKGVRTPPGSGPDAARQALVKTGLREEIPVSPRGSQKVGNLIDSLNAEVEARLDAAQRAGKTVDPAIVEQEIRNVASNFTEQINAQPELAAIEAVRENFMANPITQAGPIPIQTAQRMKSNTYQGLRGKYGKELGGTIEAEKAGARGLKEQIEQGAPEVAGLNAREGAAIPLDEAIADAMRRRGNYGLFGLTPVVAAIPAIAHGNVWPLLGAMVDRAPGVVSRTGIWINRTGQRSGRATQGAARAATVANQTSASVPAMAAETRGDTPERSVRRR
jgi:hypothetical protein